MLHLRKADERGPTNLGWLDSRHTFSFGHYYDPRFSGFHDLLVINEDRVAAGAGFPPHPHGDMEILSYVIAGALEHRDSLGNGFRHSEHNASKTEPVHFLQIWITPERNGIEPSYEQKRLPPPDGTSRLDLIGSRDGRGGSVTIHQDVDLYRATVRAGDTRSLDIRDGRAAWVQAVAGRATVSGISVSHGDGLALTSEDQVRVTAEEDAELLIFDLA